MCGAAAHAQAPQDDAASLEQVVVTATALPTTHEKIGSSLTVIDRRQIEDGGYNLVPDVLRQVPGLSISRTGAFGGPTQVRTRGAEANHTIVLFNGIDVSDAGQGEVDLATLLAVNIERIEVLRGPQSGLYGSNALAGVINILTPRENNGSHYNFTAEHGSFHSTRVLAGGGVGNGDYFVEGGAGLLDSDGFDASAMGAVNGPPGVTGDKEGYRNVTGYVSAGLKVSPALRFDGFARYVDTSTQLDGFDFSFIPGQQGLAFDDASRTSTQSYNVAGSGTLALLADRWITVAAASYTHSHAEGEDSIPGNEYGDKSYRAKYSLQSSVISRSNALANTFTAFVEGKQESFRNTHPFSASQGASQSRDLFGVGLQDQLGIAEQLYLSASWRHDNNDKFDDVDTYSLAASWVIAGTDTRPHASYGKGVTNPSFYEQFGFDPGTYVGNPDLRPESAKGWDLGIEQGFAGRAMVDVTWFNSTLDDEISACFPSTCNETESSRREGVEISARIVPTETIDLVGSYTRLRAREGNPSTVEVRRPKSQASLDASWRSLADRLRLTVGATYNGEQFDTDYRQFGNPDFFALKTRLPSYATLRLVASYRFTPRLEVFARVENAFDEDYEEVIGYTTAGRAGYIGVRLTGE